MDQTGLKIDNFEQCFWTKIFTDYGGNCSHSFTDQIFGEEGITDLEVNPYFWKVVFDGLPWFPLRADGLSCYET